MKKLSFQKIFPKNLFGGKLYWCHDFLESKEWYFEILSNLGAEDMVPMPIHEYRCKVCKQIFATSAKVIAHAVNDHPAYSNDVDHIFEEVKSKHPNMISRMLMDQDGSPSMVPR